MTTASGRYLIALAVGGLAAVVRKIHAKRSQWSERNSERTGGMSGAMEKKHLLNETDYSRKRTVVSVGKQTLLILASFPEVLGGCNLRGYRVVSCPQSYSEGYLNCLLYFVLAIWTRVVILWTCDESPS